MKKIIFITLLCVFVILFSQAKAQSLIAVQNGSAPKFFQQVDDAITNSTDGDTIYIPGGSWNIGVPINKRLHLIGVGHHPDSTKVTFPTTIIGEVTLATGASNGSLTGILIKDGFNSSNATISSYSVSRCRISILQFSSKNSNFMFVENILEQNISSSGPESASNFSFLNNFIGYLNGVYFPNNSIYKNNIFSYSSWYGYSSQYSLFENNIFFSNIISSILNSTFKNNLFVPQVVFPNGTNVGSNNIVNQELTTIFVNQEGSTFNYTHDYHLQSTCPGKNAGTDGTDIGIYGGIYPWKAGSVPANPHFQSLKISPTTDTNGNLNVKIKVAAQDH